MVATESKRKIIGTRPVRPDGTDKVTGRAEYGGDVRLPRMLYGRVKRSPHAHARIKRIDASKALALDGVQAVLTSEDFPRLGDELVDLGETFAPYKYVRDNGLASDKALYAGHAVRGGLRQRPAHRGGRARPDRGRVRAARPRDERSRGDGRRGAARARAPAHDRDGGRFVPSDQRADDTSNIASHLRFELGDIEQGFEEADIVLEREFETATAHQGYIEPHNGTAFWNADGRITVWLQRRGRSRCASRSLSCARCPSPG